MPTEDGQKEKEDEEQHDNDNNSQSGKKIKLNDGSSQSISASESKGPENVDSGISADRSESMCSDDPTTSNFRPPTPANFVVTAGASMDSVRHLLRSMRGRNYRKRRNPVDSDSDSDSSSSLDSDDMAGGVVPESAQDDISMDSIPFIEEMPSEDSSNGSSDLEMDNYDDDEDDDSDELMSSDDSDDFLTSRARWMGFNIPSEQIVNLSPNADTPAVLNKEQPLHKWSAVREVFNREMGFNCHKFGKTFRQDVVFERRFYGSLHAVYRLKKYHRLCKHKGCVNCINFHPEGHILASGSDDTNIIVWDWAHNKMLQKIKSGHRSNVFQCRFLYLDTSSQMNIVTCAKDGQVRLLTTPAAGGPPYRRKLYSHSRAVHKVFVSPQQPHEILSAAEDGKVLQTDIRTDTHQQLLELKNSKDGHMALYCVHGHPLDTNKFIVAGRDKFVRAYDIRNTKAPFATYCPSFFIDVPNSKGPKMAKMYLTCAIYNHDGTEILGSYNDEDVYLFDSVADVYQSESPKVGFTHRYSGHRNCVTFKGVSFFGPESQYVMSGSDCSYIYIWDKKTEAIVQWLQGDSNGVVNCIESHPKYPVLASSGLDYDVKLWLPTLQEDPTFEGLEPTVKVNSSPHFRNSVFNIQSIGGRVRLETEAESSLHVNANGCSLI